MDAEDKIRPLANPACTPLDGDQFANALISGIHCVIAEQDTLNRINVFPVADSDTGTNLSLSLGAILPVLESQRQKNLGTLLATVADVALDSSRGNSGAIIAQFLQGMSDSALSKSTFTTATFGQAIAMGSEYARDALSDPMEGTILSVISAFAASFRHDAARTDDDNLVSEFERALQCARGALEDTTQQLDVLRKAGVVDAGAAGFVALLSGMQAYIAHGRIVPRPDLSFFDAESHLPSSVGNDDDSVYRFCTECIVTGVDIDRRKLREGLSKLGSSLVLAGTKRKAKIHIHVNDPDTVFSLAQRFGTVSLEKADDIHRQQHSSHNAVNQFAVITDSAADIADDDMDRLDIHLVPCRIQFGDRGYLDKVSITADEFYAELDSNPNYPTTSQPSPGDYRRQLQFLASHFKDVVLLSVTAKASGAIYAARAAAERVSGAGRVHVIDSKTASTAQGLLAIFAAECAAAGMGVKETISALESLIPQTRCFALLHDLNYPVRGGRVPKILQTLATLFRLLAIIQTVPDGRITGAGFLFGKHDRLRRFSRFIARRTPAGQPLNIAIGHALCAEDAAELERHLRERLPAIRTITVTDLGAALGVHCGRGTLVVSMQPCVKPGEIVGQEQV